MAGLPTWLYVHATCLLSVPGQASKSAYKASSDGSFIFLMVAVTQFLGVFAELFRKACEVSEKRELCEMCELCD